MNTSQVINAFVALAMGLPSVAASCIADDTATGSERQLVDQWYAVYQRIHESMRMSVLKNNSETTPLASQQVMTLHNPLRRGVRHGRVYVWTDGRRPVAVGSLWSEVDVRDATVRNVTYEFHSLSQRPVIVEQNGKRVWHCRQPGVDWQVCDGAEAPAASQTVRLTQLRQIARSYLVRGGPAVGSGEATGVYELLPQPLYRYPQQTPNKLDGALFSYSDSSDPRVFLLLEARNDRWWVAFARSTVLPLRVSRRGQTVWAVERTRGNGWRTVHNDSDPFFIHYGRERRLAAAPNKVLTSLP